MADRLRVLELFCGIGGCSAALDGRAEVVAAIDVNRNAIAVYQHNFRHPVAVRTIESLRREDFTAWPADLWWLSPPCQPYTSRGHQRDVDDPRAASLLNLLDRIREMRPPYLAVENVPGFAASQARFRLLDVLQECAYQVRELVLCPTELGIPNQRRRYFLIAAQGELRQCGTPLRVVNKRPIAHILSPHVSQYLEVPSALIDRYRGAIHAVEPHDPQAVTHCFTSAYGKSMTSSGSYLKHSDVKYSDRFRRFAPEEQLRLLGFPPSFSLPPYQHPRQIWPLIGNSLSIDSTRFVLSAIPELADLPLC